MPSPVDVFVYARIDSYRLPGKALIELGGMKLIERVIRRAQMVDAGRCVLLTTDRVVDDSLVEVARAQGIVVVRGDAHNLVNRTIKAIKELDTQVFVRVNGDSPFFEPQLVNVALENFRSVDFISNLPLRLFPYGVGVEIVTSSSYIKAANLATPAQVEHVTKHLYGAGVLTKRLLGQTQNQGNLHLALDTPDDRLRLSKLMSGHPFDAPYWEIFGREKPELFWI